MRIKISAGAERDIADGCDFYDDIGPNLATYFHDSISADIDSLLLYAGVHAKLSTLCSTAGAIQTAMHRRCVDGSSRTNDSINRVRTVIADRPPHTT